ncbi:MAG: peptidoglycan DD-metalloendopeptidase family protein [Clostridiales bacterium]|nr:peptidoglycan DD-metalloendopeptidase family protein [Candidatus Equinaster intestinalis]
MKELFYAVFCAVQFSFLKLKGGIKNIGVSFKNAAGNLLATLKYFFKIAAPYFKALKSKAFIIWGLIMVALFVGGFVFVSRTMHIYEVTMENDCIGYTRNEEALNTAVESLKKQFPGDKEIEAELEKFGIKQVQTNNIFLKTLDDTELKNTVINCCDTISFASCVYIDNERKLCAYGDKTINNVITNFKKDKSKAVSDYTSCEFELLNTLDLRSECVAVRDITEKEIYRTLYDIFNKELKYRVTFLKTEETEIPYLTSYTRSDKLEIGDKVIKQRGVNGITKTEKRIVVENGKTVEEKVVSQKTTKKAVTEKILVGNGYFSGLDSHSGLFLPVEGKLVSGFGVRSDPFTKEAAMHTGLDISAPMGTEIMAAADGKVVKASDTNNGYGNCVIIEHYDGYRTLYGHCSELLVEVGDYVSAGEVIALVGSTGRSTGPHLHFSIIIDGVFTDPSVYF